MTALGDFSAGDVLTAADLNAIGTWTDYTPSLLASTTSPTYSTATGLYYELNEIVFVRFVISGVTSGGSGTYYITMPTDISGDTLFPQAFGMLTDGSSRYPITGAKSSSGANRLFWVANHDRGVVTAADPFTWSSADQFMGTCIYKKD